MKSWFSKMMHLEQERFFLWIPVCLGVGIWIYFDLLEEPSLTFLLLLGACMLVLGGVALHSSSLGKRRALWGIVLCGGGFCLSAYRVASLDPPLLHEPLGPCFWEATIESVALSARETHMRTVLILKNLETSCLPPHLQLPQRVRLPLKGMDVRWRSGQRIGVKAVWVPISKAPSPLGFDPRRHAFLKRIGATGYALSDIKLLDPGSSGDLGERMRKMRQNLTHQLMTSLSFPLGNLAAALITGEASTLSPQIREIFAGAGIAHVLAISGLHLSLVAGFIFWVVRGALSLFPGVALRYPLHKVAAFFALGASFFYLQLSGAAPPACRAFLMTSLVMTALVVDRRALTFRNIALAALGILVTTPESLLGASFQLSFSAVIALVATYEICWKPLQRWMTSDSLTVLKKIGGCGLSSLLSSIVATLATTPFTIVFFHQLTLQSLLSNLLVIPLISFCVMPLSVLGCLLYFVGGSTSAFSLLASPLGILWAIAQEVNTWPGTHFKVPVGAPWAFPVFVGGALWVCLWRSSLRWAGVGGALAGLVGLLIPHVPDFWMDGEGKLMGFFDSQSRILWVSSLQRGSFARALWAEASGALEVKVFPKIDTQGWGKAGEGVFWTLPPQKSCLFILENPEPNFPPQNFPLILSLSSGPLALGKSGIFLGPVDVSRYGSHVLWMSKKNPYALRIQRSYPLKEGRRWH